MRSFFVTVFALFFLVRPAGATETHREFDVVIAGGSTAAFAAAVSASQEGARVALLEPTDWIGGQITSSGVPAIDEAWHKLHDANGKQTMDVAKIARTPANISPLLRDMLSETGCPGNCWVSRFCFQPRQFLEQHLLPLERAQSNLTVFRNTVVKRVGTEGNRIVSLTAIERSPKKGHRDVVPSEALRDWYSFEPTEYLEKTTHVFAATASTVFIDATEWGEVLALSDAPYLIGVEHKDGGLQGDETLGQAITFGFVQELHERADANRDASVPRPEGRQLGMGDYADKPNGWELIWTYRRLASSEKEVATGDLSLQNWGYYPNRSETGNDYPFGYFFLTRNETAKQRSDWLGGVDLSVMAGAERQAFAWHHHFKSIAPSNIGKDRISLATHVLGTSHGLSKLPYIRDTRRSIGIGDFLLTVADVMPVAPGQLAKTFDDRIALGAYPVDIHPLADRQYPEYIYEHHDVAPFTIPFRSLTNKRFGNLLVTGKTMAQTFLANSATRLHPTEWSTGTAAGVVAAFMHDNGQSSGEAYGEIEKVQSTIKRYTPIDWTR